MISFQSLRVLDVLLLLVTSWTLFKFVQAMRKRVVTTKLNGPTSSNWLFGVAMDVFYGDSGDLFEKWAKEYGPVYQVPASLGEKLTVLTDPRAIAHFYSKETYTYVNSDFVKKMIDNMV